MYKKLVLVGGLLIAVFNPLAVNIWADALITGLEILAEELVNISDYTMVIGSTLTVVGLLMWHSERGKKETKRLKKLKSKKSKKSPKYLDL